LAPPGAALNGERGTEESFLPFCDKLNPEQRAAVETVEGALLILAGAGSGKTRVITYRIAHLIDNLNVAPDAILAVTFTNKAAQEMAERVAQLCGGSHFAKPWISTFHSMCVRLLRRDIEKLQINGKGLTKQFVIYDEADQQAVVKAAMKRLGLNDREDRQFKPAAVLGRISWAKNHMLDPQEFYLQSKEPKSERIAHIYEYYRRELARANALDFDDLLLEAVRLLKAVPAVREHYNRRFQYLLVDEYQDTNRPQYELMRLLAGERQNVCAVGDEDQSIYSWRGADIRNILEFEHDFPRARIIRLEQNYRSTQNILEAASAVVAHNLKRKGKNLWTARAGGERIGYYEAPDGENEALFAADYMAHYLAKAAETGEGARAAVLYRTNSQSRLMEEALRRYGLKYKVVGGFSFYERAEIKDMISYLKLALNPDDTIALQRVINTPPRGIGKSTMEIVERLALETGSSVWVAIGEAVRRKLVPTRAQTALRQFCQIIADARAMLAGTFGEQLEADAAVADVAAQPANLALPDEPAGLDVAAASAPAGDDTSFDFGLSDEVVTAEPGGEDEANNGVAAAAGAATDGAAPDAALAAAADTSEADAPEAPGGASTAEILKFIIDRTGYIKALEAEDTPESLARVENLRELVNAAMDSRDRGESLGEFLDHAALTSDTDDYEAASQITLMTLHAAKGLEFPLVFLVGLEEGLFPHARTFNSPDEIEEERRLCYVGMTRAMDTLVISRARYRRRWGTDMPEASIPSRFLEEIPPQLIVDLGSPGGGRARRDQEDEVGCGPRRDYYDGTSVHPNYEDEDQRPAWSRGATPAVQRSAARPAAGERPAGGAGLGGKSYNSIDNIAEFFASRGKQFVRPAVAPEAPTGRTGFRPGQRVRHPKYGEGTVYRREGDGDMAKITVQFQRFGLKKLVEKYAQLERA
jgi:DNA helicase-2/ATP-dependent DNA helicase PcrA